MSKTWFITGTSSGFGRLMTESLLARGDRVAATLRKVEVLDDLKAKHGARLWVARLDVTDATAVRQVVDRAFGELDRFVEAAAQEVASFGITFTIAEPGPTRTDFGRNIVSPPALAVYDGTPVGTVRRAVAERSLQFSEPARMVDAMIDSVDQSPAPRRLVMGNGAYSRVRAALVDRLSALDAQKDIALAVDSTG